jgi:hypothetical protein
MMDDWELLHIENEMRYAGLWLEFTSWALEQGAQLGDAAAPWVGRYLSAKFERELRRTMGVT